MLNCLKKAKNILKSLKSEVSELKDKNAFHFGFFTGVSDKVDILLYIFEEIENFAKEHVADLKVLLPEDVELHEILKDSNARIGGGSFGDVYKSKLMGTSVAVKVIKDDAKLDFSSEIRILRLLHHDNIVAYRGSGSDEKKKFVVMEFVELQAAHISHDDVKLQETENAHRILKDNLHDYIHARKSGNEGGLSAFLTWHIAQQIGNALVFLHSCNITHRDIKPDNILLDLSGVYPKPKLCDFGFMWHLDKSSSSDIDIDPPPDMGHLRYASSEEENHFESSKRRDRFTFGLVILEMRTANRPWDDLSTISLANLSKADIHETAVPQSSKSFWMVKGIKISDEIVTGKLGKVVKECCKNSLKKSLDGIMRTHFNKENPFQANETKGEFFSCGFLTNTNIFVVDSVVPEHVSTYQNDEKKIKLPTYQKDYLLHEVDLKPNEEDYIPKEEKLRDEYDDNMVKYNKQAEDNVFSNFQILALKEITTYRTGDDETQKITLKFIKSHYCHHRAMRDIWRKFDEVKKNKILSNKLAVNKFYSTSFGLHIAILTNEGDGKKKFVFTQRSTRPGAPSPGAFTCGAVRSCSISDITSVPQKRNKTATVSLINTAARGLREELGLDLSEKERDAISLNTTYLKFDNHEWGMCGFVDLTDEKIEEDNRMSFQRLNAAFTGGSKDKFEHSRIYGVDFELKTIVEWVRKEHNNMASSAKIVVYSVLKAYFGTARVTKQFEEYM